MSEISHCSHESPNVARLVGERRTTDRILRLWKNSKDKKSMLNALGRSSLWDHCFLFVVDDELECSVIIDHGNSAARGLALGRHGVEALRNLPYGLARRIHRLGLECRRECAPSLDESELEDASDSAVHRYRLALVPLTKSGDGWDLPRNEVVSMLGVFTYQ